MAKKPEHPIKPTKNFINKALIRTIGRHLATSPLPAIIFVSTFVLIRWWNNSDFSYLTEVYLMILLFSVLAGIIYYIYRWIFGAGLASLVASIAMIYLLYVYQFAQNSSFGKFIYGLIPGGVATPFNQSLLFVLILGVLVGVLSWALQYLVNRFDRFNNLQIYKIIVFTVIFVFAVQIFKTLDRYVDIHSSSVYSYPAPKYQKDSTKTVKAKPDIYFLMPEDYASSQTLQSVNNYNNSSVLGFLSSQGFANRQPVFYSNFPFTMSSLSSNLAMNYFPQFQKMFGKSSWQSGFPYRSIIKNPPIAQVLKQNGYQYNQVSSWWDFSRIGIKADTNAAQGYKLDIFSAHFYLSDLQRDILNKSLLTAWLTKGITIGHKPIIKYEKDYSPSENLAAQISSIKAIAGRTDKSTPQFTFGHFMIPHTPYIFNADGSTPDYDSEHNDEGAEETLKYANQVAYFNSQIKDMVSYIRSKSPNAIIMLQSDEGSYPPQFRYEQTENHFYNPINLPTAEMKQKFSILASYFMPGVSQDKIQQQIDSPVNAFRFVLNQYLGYSLPYLPNCNFATGNKFKVYNYMQVNDKLSGHSNPACSQYE